MSRANPVSRDSSVKPPTVKMRPSKIRSAGQPASSPNMGEPRHRPALEAADCYFKARYAFIARDCRLLAVADGCDESLQLCAQRLRMANREMPHRIASVRLESEAFSHLPGQQVAHDVFVASHDSDIPRLEGCEPIRVDVRQYTGGSAELEERDVLTLGERAGELRLHLNDLRFREPTDEIDVVDGEIDHHAHIGHARRERPNACDGDGQNILRPDSVLDRLDRWIETLHVADHEGNSGMAGGGDNASAFSNRRRDRFFD